MRRLPGPLPSTGSSTTVSTRWNQMRHEDDCVASSSQRCERKNSDAALLPPVVPQRPKSSRRNFLFTLPLFKFSERARLPAVPFSTLLFSSQDSSDESDKVELCHFVLLFFHRVWRKSNSEFSMKSRRGWTPQWEVQRFVQIGPKSPPADPTNVVHYGETKTKEKNSYSAFKGTNRANSS